MSTTAFVPFTVVLQFFYQAAAAQRESIREALHGLAIYAHIAVDSLDKPAPAFIETPLAVHDIIITKASWSKETTCFLIDSDGTHHNCHVNDRFVRVGAATAALFSVVLSPRQLPLALARPKGYRLTPFNNWTTLLDAETVQGLLYSSEVEAPALTKYREDTKNWQLLVSIVPELYQAENPSQSMYLLVQAPAFPPSTRKQKWYIPLREYATRLPELLYKKALAKNILQHNPPGFISWSNLTLDEVPVDQAAYHPYWINPTHLKLLSPYVDPHTFFDSENYSPDHEIEFEDIVAYIAEKQPSASAPELTEATLQMHTQLACQFVNERWFNLVSC